MTDLVGVPLRPEVVVTLKPNHFGSWRQGLAELRGLAPGSEDLRSGPGCRTHPPAVGPRALRTCDAVYPAVTGKTLPKSLFHIPADSQLQ